MRQSLTIFCVSLSLHALAQWDYRPLAPDPSARRAQTAELPAIDLPFWDDFSYSGTAPDSLWEFSENVFINESLSINPPTYKAATFDGVTADGQVYDPDDQFPGLTDQLVSRRVRLASLIDDEEIYLSFFWQMGGNGEAPEASGDSLRLQFLNADSVWVTVWKRQATQVSDTETFTQAILKVEPAFRHDDFRFKFDAFGSLQGPFDTWHVDYVYLNNGRSSNDLFYDDQALVSLTSLIAPYREMPAEHFFANTVKYVVAQSCTAFNLSNQGVDTSVINCEVDVYGPDDVLIENISFVNGDKTIMGSQITNTFTLDADTGTDGIQPVSFGTTLPVPDSVRIDVEINSNFTDLYRINDTLRVSYQLQKHYAYDDGVAEFAAGVRQNGTIAVLFVTEVQDTLSHIDIYFPAVVPSSVNKVVQLKVWRDLDLDPIVTQSHTITATGRNEFSRIELNQKVVVADSIYIGYTQVSPEYVGVGLDRSNVAANERVYYKIATEWEQNETLNGMLMIRAVFGDVPDFALSSPPQSPRVKVWPNPSNGLVQIDGDYHYLTARGMDGREVVSEHRKRLHDFSFLPSGVYLLEIFTADGQSQTLKFVKQ